MWTWTGMRYLWLLMFVTYANANFPLMTRMALAFILAFFLLFSVQPAMPAYMMCTRIGTERVRMEN